jgi:hypothetical protein
LTIGARGDAVCYPLHIGLPAEPSRTSRLLARLGLGGTFIAIAVAIMTIAIGITGARLSQALAARSDLPLNAESSSDGIRYRLLGSVVANQPLTNDLPAEIEAESDEEELPSLFSAMAFNAGAFEPDTRSLADPDTIVAAERFVLTAPDYARVSRFEPNRFQEAVALADVTPLPRKRPKLAALTPFDGLGVNPEDNFIKTAIYDITAQVVYMPNGDRLEAHSGLGPKMDDPRHVHIRMHGATPPNTYRLTMREKLFHGVEAVRLTPVGEGNMFGRAGILAHTYMLGPNGQSNGCVSFKDYSKFLAAFKRGEVERMVVVAKLDRPPAIARAVEPENKFASLLKLFGVESR